MSDAPTFDDFWRQYPHRPACRPKATCRAYWNGTKPLADGSRIKPEQWGDIVRAAEAYAELHGYNDFRINAQRFLYQGEWEGALEEKQERDQAAAGMEHVEGSHAWQRARAERLKGGRAGNVVEMPARQRRYG